jgi:hypothetical protein
MTNVSIKVTGVKEVNKRLSNLRRYTAKVANAPVPTVVSRQALDASLKQAQEFYKTPTNKPRYPLRWKSDKQRIAVIIRLKEEGNLPYKRTGKHDKQWVVHVKQNTITIANEARDPKTGKFYAGFTIGAFQQPFHADTGYTKRTASIEKQILKPITSDMLKRAKEGIEASKNG